MHIFLQAILLAAGATVGIAVALFAMGFVEGLIGAITKKHKRNNIKELLDSDPRVAHLVAELHKNPYQPGQDNRVRERLQAQLRVLVKDPETRRMLYDIHESEFLDRIDWVYK